MKRMKRVEDQRNGVDQAATSPRPKSLRELGVAGPLAAELEAALRAAGKVQGRRVVGFSFVTPDGVSHALCVREQGVREQGVREQGASTPVPFTLDAVTART
jgi:hypothetical protein